MRIAVDAMGGDYAPGEIVRGAIEGSRCHGVDVVLVGDEEAIRKNLPRQVVPDGVSIRHTSQAIGMHEHVDAVRTKRDASVVVCASLVHDREADAMISLGNTATAMAAATLKLGRIRGIDRPAIATIMPGRSGPTVLLDAGAVVDCSVAHLVQFAVMGGIYAEKVLDLQHPRISLLSVGEEESKGSELVRSAHAELAASGLNFVGNVEGRDLFSGVVDVIVADGFSGNVALKTAEGLTEYVTKLIVEELRSHPLTWIPVALLRPALKRLLSKLDYSEYGGAPLLGLDGICIIGHGRSRARAVTSAVRAAKEAVSGGVVEAIRNMICAGETSACGRH